MCDVSKSVEYTQMTMDVALKKVEKIEANLGGTEILKPLKHIFSQTCIPGQPRQVMEITQCKHTCLFCLLPKNANDINHINELDEIDRMEH